MNPLPKPRRTRARTAGLAVVLWAFGLATTTLLVGLWGRAVTTDQPTLEASSRAALSAEVVTDRIHNWLAEAVGTSAGAFDPGISHAVDLIAESPEAERAIDRVIEEIVQAALAEPGTRAAIDIGHALEPLMPIVVAELAANGLDVPLEEINRAIDGAANAVLETEASTISGAAYRARSVLTTVFGAGLAALVIFGSLAVALAEEHLAMIRSLAIRVAVSAFTFTILLRLGSWATDPIRGRSPLASGGSVVLNSNHLVLFMVAAAALCVALSSGVVIQRRRLWTAVDPTALSAGDTTEERVLIGV